jgi:hypothetical protein
LGGPGAGSWCCRRGGFRWAGGSDRAEFCRASLCPEAPRSWGVGDPMDEGTEGSIWGSQVEGGSFTGWEGEESAVTEDCASGWGCPGRFLQYVNSICASGARRLFFCGGVVYFLFSAFSKFLLKLCGFVMKKVRPEFHGSEGGEGREAVHVCVCVCVCVCARACGGSGSSGVQCLSLKEQSCLGGQRGLGFSLAPGVVG